MKKIPTLFKRDEETHLVVPELVPEAAWVIRGEGRATRKWDGTACLWTPNGLFKRYTVKLERTVPTDFVPSASVDPITGKQEGWVPIGEGKEDRWHREALDSHTEVLIPYQTYELCGPKIQANPEGFDKHVLIQHGVHELATAPRDYVGLQDFLSVGDIEGIVWHHPNGMMAKIKGRDFGIKRQPQVAECEGEK